MGKHKPIARKPNYPEIQRLSKLNGIELLRETWDGKPLTDLGNVVRDVPKVQVKRIMLVQIWTT